MNFWQAFILGVVEGITEFLPVSSTGHLLLTQRLLGIPASAVANAYAIVIQGGAILAVVGIYHKRILEMLRGLLQKNSPGQRLAMHLVIAFLPAAALGFLFDHKIEKYLFGIWAIVAAWIVGGIGLIIFARTFQKEVERAGRFGVHELTTRQAFIIGCAQALALWPGTSRSLVTIVAGLLIGLALPAALEFSFLLGLLTLGVATGYKVVKLGPEMFSSYGAAIFAVGFLTACFFAAVSIKWMIGYLQHHTMIFFGYWRLTVAALAMALLYLGFLNH